MPSAFDSKDVTLVGFSLDIYLQLAVIPANVLVDRSGKIAKDEYLRRGAGRISERE